MHRKKKSNIVIKLNAFGETAQNNNTYLDLCEDMLENSNCLRKHYASIIVKNRMILGYGTNHTPERLQSCTDLGYCIREKLNIPRGEHYEMCRGSIHSEQDVIMKVGKSNCNDAVLYLVGKEKDGTYVKDAEPCNLCKKFIIDCNIKYVIVRDNKKTYRILNVQDWVDKDTSKDGKTGY